ncbi:GspE/PulE family protein [Coprothermobacter platensis]|uniref:GspE/PulE family protein n=1 Tax=Coprothermobacter platensis TaxID=108819 RepID=UPI00036D426F|nr:GspE/PulE family protein [Coprothermobacter platensis]
MAEPLAQLLAEKGYLRFERIDEVVGEAKRQGLRLGQYLVAEGIIKKNELGQVLAEQYGKSYIDSEAIIRLLDLNSLKSMQSLSAYLSKPEEQLTGLMRTYRLIPLQKEQNKLLIAVVPPLEANVSNQLKSFFGVDLDYLVTTEQDFSEVVMDRFFSLNFFTKSNETRSQLREIKVSSLDLLSTEASAENAINAIIYDAAHRNATDVHFVATQSQYVVKYRLDGIVQQIVTLPRALAEEIVTRVKVLADMDIAEKRRPQDGQFDVMIESQPYSIRVATVGSIYGENMFMRLLYRRSLRTGLDNLGMLPEQISLIRDMIKKPYGIIVTTGPTGSGKTTTLYALLKEIYEARDKNIITIEDPVEYDFEGITQVQMNPKADITFSSTLRAALRQDPDIILLGEIRDEETLHAALDAALSGHLVLSTLHANNAVAAVARFMSMGADPLLVASALHCVMAQRLVRLWDNSTNSYKGRTGVYEILPVDDEIRSKISQKTDVVQLFQTAKAKGFISMEEIARFLVDQGLTTEEEVVRVFGYSQ